MPRCTKKSAWKNVWCHSTKKNKVSAIFCPDLVTAYYAKSTLDLLKAKGIQFVAKDESPPNVLELRSIERYRAIVKQNLIR